MRFCLLTFASLLVACSLFHAPVDDDRAAAEPAMVEPPDGGHATADSAPRVESNLFCVHQRRPDLGAPAHREQGGKGGFVRLEECSKVTVIEKADRWYRVAFTQKEGRTEGWISKRYLMSCDPCDGDGGPGDRSSDWPAQPSGLCESSGATGQERVLPAEPQTAGPGAKGRPGVQVTVVSYNLFELYDGQGEPSYLSSKHRGVPAKQYAGRLDLFAKVLRPIDADVALFQEIESAEVACVLASKAWPGSSFACFGSQAPRGAHPQNIAIATRLQGQAKVLRPASARESGPRPALELSLAGAGGLTVTAVHLKSSRGRSSHQDCSNARQRMGMAAALAHRYQGWSSVLLAGDFNVDPMDRSRALYDRTDDILIGRSFDRSCPAAGCAVATYPGYGSAIDLSFFRAGGAWAVSSTTVVKAPLLSQNPLASDHLPLVVTLSR